MRIGFSEDEWHKKVLLRCRIWRFRTQKTRQRRVSLNCGARTRTKMPGAFLPRAPARPVGRATGCGEYIEPSITGSLQNEKNPPEAGFFKFWCPNPDKNAGSIFALRACATRRASHRMWRVYRTFDNGFAPERKKPARGGFL